MSRMMIKQTDGGIVFTAKIIPGSSRTVAAGLLDGMVKIKVAAPAEKGKANQCLVEFLAEKLGVKKKDVSIVSGQGSPVKQIKVDRISAEELAEKLGFE